MAMATFTPVNFYLSLSISEMLDYAEIIGDMTQ